MQKLALLGCADVAFIHWVRCTQQSAHGVVIQLDATYPD
jgi:hypothetical protein